MNLFAQIDYREAIEFLLSNKLGRGARTKLSEVLNCQPGYISQVLNKSKIHFSSENVIKIARFLELSPVEEDFLLNLLLLERAGSEELQQYFQKKVQQIKNEHLRVEKQIKDVNRELDEAEKAIYYSHWAYSAIHMLVSLEAYRKPEKMAEKLKINLPLTMKILDFLVEKKLVLKNKNSYSVGKTRIHLKGGSPFIKSHHQNFRQKAIQSLEEENEFDLHYSSVMTLSAKDTVKIRELLLKLLADKEKILIPSPDEEMICLNFDLIKF